MPKHWTVAPYTPGKDPDIDMYFGSWKESMPYSTHGSLIERDILTRGDAMKPPRKAAVLEFVNRFTHATLDARALNNACQTRTGTGDYLYPRWQRHAEWRWKII